jgi:hypothetical protein
MGIVVPCFQTRILMFSSVGIFCLSSVCCVWTYSCLIFIYIYIYIYIVPRILLLCCGLLVSNCRGFKVGNKTTLTYIYIVNHFYFIVALTARTRTFCNKVFLP